MRRGRMRRGVFSRLLRDRNGVAGEFISGEAIFEWNVAVPLGLSRARGEAFSVLNFLRVPHIE